MISFYDYIIAGTGCAGLSLALEMERTGFADGKRILLIDRAVKDQNDRTWCFWETGEGPFESIVYHRWPKAWFRSSSFASLLDLAPYTYKMIRGIDFYSHAIRILSNHSSFEIVQAELRAVGGMPGAAYAEDETGNRYEAKQLFSSILFEQPQLKKNEHYLLQHFRGWIIDAAPGSFDPAVATLMDFRVSQQHGCTFGYVLPFTDKQALVEYTLFTKARLNNQEYEEGLRDYIKRWLNIADYRIIEQEDGIIPMTSHRFSTPAAGVVMLGTAGGQTKASSGYTFQFIQKHSTALVESLQKQPLLDSSPTTSSTRFHFYDKVMLDVLAAERLPGDVLFSTLFKKNETAAVLAFLDNETSFSQDLAIISSLPIAPFLKAALAQL